MVYGLDPADIPEFLTLNNTYGQGTTNLGVNEVLVGSSIASNFGVTVGDRIKIGSVTASSRPQLRIAGVLNARGTVADGVSTDNAIVVNSKWYTNQYGGKDEYNQVNIIVKDTDNIPDIETAIDAKINTNAKSPAIRIRDAESLLATTTSTLGTVTTFIMAIGGISLVVAAVSIFNVMMMSVNERIQEIGILLSIGTERGEVRRMFLYEAFILGLLGATDRRDMQPDHRVFCRGFNDRDNAVFLHVRQHRLRPAGNGHRDRGLHCLRGLPGMEGFQHGPDRCPAE